MAREQARVQARVQERVQDRVQAGMDVNAREPARPTRVWPLALSVVAVAALPGLGLLAANLGEPVQLGTVAAWFAITAALGLVMVSMARLRGPATARRAAVVVVALLVLAFRFPATTALNDTLNEALDERWGWLLPDTAWWVIVAVVVAAMGWWLARRHGVQVFVAILGPALLLQPVVQLVLATAASPAMADDAEPDLHDGMGEDLPTLARTPNVYFFVLDGHAGPDFLRERTGFDPDPFLAALRTDGFRVSEHATSNYPFTNLSVSSTLEMDYGYEGREEPFPDPFFDRLQGDNRTADIFLANDYAYLHTWPGLWSGSRCSGREDWCLGGNGPVDDTTVALASMTPLLDVVVDDSSAAAVATANDPLWVTRRILANQPEDRPTWNFIHLLNPHPPLLRDADCGVRDVDMELSAWGDGPEYGDAVACLDRRLQQSIEEILAVDPDPVIVIQGDHGPRLGIDYDTDGGVTLDDDMYFSILSAIRLPQACDDVEVPDDLTSVNTFRIVFACLEDRPLDLLEDRRFPIHRDG